MDRVEAQKHLNALVTGMKKAHPDSTARLEQLDAHVATVAMVVDHLFDEAETG